MKLRFMYVVLLAVATACAGAEGPMGPPGPAGPQGPVGPAGSVGRANLTGTIGSSGGVTALLPADAVRNNSVPVIACFISNDRQTWLAIAQTPATSGSPFCGLTGIGTSAPGITMINVSPGWFYYIIAVW